MKILTTTNARKHFAEIINRVRFENAVFGIGRRDRVDALMMRFPAHYNHQLNEVTNLNAHSGSFDFLKDEPDLYSVDDLKKRYA